MEYVIERMNGETREWWTGQEWSDVDTGAAWYETREQAEKAVTVIGGTVTGFDVD